MTAFKQIIESLMQQRGRPPVGKFNPGAGWPSPPPGQMNPALPATRQAPQQKTDFGGGLDPEDSDFLFSLPDPMKSRAMQRINSGEPPRSVLGEIFQQQQAQQQGQQPPPSNPRSVPQTPTIPGIRAPQGQQQQSPQRFNDAGNFRTAQAGDFGALDTGGDSVTLRGLTGDEVQFRNAASRLSNIDNLLEENPEILDSLTWTGNTRRKALSLMDKTGVFDLNDEQNEFLSDATVFRQNVLRNINRTIKEVTGAQMGEAEAKRIRAEMPDVDAGPVEFKAKLAAAMNMLRMDIARLNVWQKSGRKGEPTEVTDEQLRETLQSAGRQFYEQSLSQGLSPADARLEAARRLSEEFGI